MPNVVPHIAEQPVSNVSQTAVASSLGNTAPHLPSGKIKGTEFCFLQPSLCAGESLLQVGSQICFSSFSGWCRKAVSASKRRAITAAEFSQDMFSGHAFGGSRQCSSGVHCQPCCTSQQRAVRFALPEKLFLQRQPCKAGPALC